MDGMSQIVAAPAMPCFAVVEGGLLYSEARALDQELMRRFDFALPDPAAPIYWRLSGMEQQVLRALALAAPGSLPTMTLNLLRDDPGLDSGAQEPMHTVVVHVHRLRRRLIEMRLPLEIQTEKQRRGTSPHGALTRYRLTRIRP